MSLEIRLFGRFAIRRDGRDVGGQVPAKAQELLAYVLLHRQHPIARETVAALLWGDTGSAQPKKNLRQALWQLQTAIDGQSGTGEPAILVADAEWLVLNPEQRYRLDVAQFEEASAAVHGIPGAELDDERASRLVDAAGLYGGDLLEGCYMDWCLLERARLQDVYLSMLDKLMVLAQARGRYEAGIHYGERVLRIDRANERTHRRLIRMRYLDGDRSSALAQYERCRAALRDELGVEPGHQTRALHEMIRNDRLDAGTAGLPEPIPAAPAHLRTYLEQLRALLLDVRQRADRGVEAVERVLHEL